MKQTKKEELLALGMQLYLWGIKVEQTRLELERLLKAGYRLSSPEMLSANQRVTQFSMEFQRIEGHFLQLKKELKANT